MTDRTPFGEILETSLHRATVMLWDAHRFPAFGSLVAIDAAPYTLYALVTHSASGPRDTTRTPHPYKKTESELLRDHPHIFEFITSWCTLLFVAHVHSSAQETVLYSTPPIPPKIHAFVRPLTPDEIHHILASPGYVHRIFAPGDQNGSPDELIGALSKNYPLSPNQQKALIEELMLIMGSEYRRIKILLSHLS